MEHNRINTGCSWITKTCTTGTLELPFQFNYSSMVLKVLDNILNIFYQDREVNVVQFYNPFGEVSSLCMMGMIQTEPCWLL